MYLERFCGEAVWSPCNKFIAVAKFGSAHILDAATLSKLGTIKSPLNSRGRGLSFSPDSRFLTQFNDRDLASWDLQTGGPLGIVTSDTVPLGSDLLSRNAFSSTYSADGKMVAVACEVWPDRGGDDDDDDDYEDDDYEDDDYGDGDYEEDYNTFITIYDFSGTHTGSYHAPEGHIITPIWTHGEFLRFSTVKPSSITIWEVPFTLTHAPAEVETLPIPDESVYGERFLFLPPLSRLAFTLSDTILIWDIRASKLLLKSEPIPELHLVWTPDIAYTSSRSSFSSDGRFFTCMNAIGDVYVWMESTAGYTLHQKLAFADPGGSAGPCLSPDGELIIMPLRSTIHLWPTRSQTLSPSSVPTGYGSDSRNIVLGFSPDENLVALGRWGGNAVTILNLQSGESQWVIEMGVGVEHLGITQSTVVVVGKGRIVTWNIPGANRASNAGANVNDNVQIIVADYSPNWYDTASHLVYMDPAGRSRTVIVGYLERSDTRFDYDAPAGRKFGGIMVHFEPTWQRLTPDGGSLVEGQEIVVEGESGVMELKPREEIRRITVIFPLSDHDYEVTDDGWVLSPSRKRLLWLPHRWRSKEEHRRWDGRFLGLLDGQLAEVVILEFYE